MPTERLIRGVDDHFIDATATHAMGDAFCHVDARASCNSVPVALRRLSTIEPRGIGIVLARRPCMSTSQRNPSPWQAPTAPTFAALDNDVSTDVVIIGAGITGITAALRLAEAGKRVVVLEARTVCSGVTGYTTAHLTEDLDAGYADVRSTFGAPAAKLVAQSIRAAIDHIGQRVTSLGIECDLEYVPAYYFTEDEAKLDDLKKELAACQEAGIDAVMADAKEIGLPWKTAGGIKYLDQARFHPIKYCRALLAAAQRLGVTIYESSQVASLSDGKECDVTLANGVHVKSQAVFCATHVPLNLLLLQTKLGHYQSYVIAYKQTPIPDALYYDNADPYHYLRLATIDGERYVVIGGNDHKTGEQADTREPFSKLIAYAQERLGLGEPDRRWSSEVHESIDGLPFIGKNSGDQHIYVATGFAGDGMTFGTVAGLLVSDLILGNANAWEKLYHATRVTPSAIGEFLKENQSVPRHLIGDRLKGSEVPSLGEIERGDGKVMRVEGKRLAVHRDDSGTLHSVSAVCPHMGCIVHFNRAERTWDCPCHGSRFAVDGAVLEGPAMQPLVGHALTDETASKTK